MCVEVMREAEEFCVLFPVYPTVEVPRALSRCTIPFLFKFEEKLRHQEVNLTRSKSYSK